MSARIHTASSMEAEVMTVAELDEAYGYEHEAEEAEDRVLVLYDGGNQEMWVLYAGPSVWGDVGRQILGLASELM